MKLRLNELGKQENVLLDVNVDYSYQPVDLLAIFCGSENELWLENDKKASAYDQYCFKRVQNIICCSFKHNDVSYTLKLGEYLENSDLGYFIINQETNGAYVTFDDYKELIELGYEKVILCDYSEYKETCEITGSQALSKREVISKIFDRILTYDDYSLFNTIPNQKDFNLFLDNVKFCKFLDEQAL